MVSFLSTAFGEVKCVLVAFNFMVNRYHYLIPLPVGTLIPDDLNVFVSSNAFGSMVFTGAPGGQLRIMELLIFNIQVS